MIKKHISSIIAISAIVVIFLAAYGISNLQPQAGAAYISSNTQTGTSVSTTSSGGWAISNSLIYLTFEEAAQMSTDVVVAEFVGQRPFGQSQTEFEFIVHERIFGNAADRIFVYTHDNTRNTVMIAGHSSMDSDRQFTTDTQYLLLLYKIADVYANTHEDGFVFLTDLILDLNDPSISTMYNEPLTLHSTGMNFNSRSLTSEEVVSYVSNLTRNNTPARDFIRSDSLEDIIEGSPCVLIVEISEPWRMARYGVMGLNDIYYTTVVEVLKGDKQIGDLVRVFFFADTVFPGERHIVSIEQLIEGDPFFYVFTSRNSLHSTAQLDEIIALILAY